MGIRVIEQTTAERVKEREDTWREMRKLMDKGYSFYEALKKVKGLTRVPQYAWVRELKDCAKRDGYEVRRLYYGKKS